MKIINIIGGLGNQMFIYAMYLALRHAHPQEKIYLCRKSYNGYPLHNGYELDRIFGVNVQEANMYHLTRLAYPFFNYRTWQFMRHFLPKRKSMTSGTTQIPFDYMEIIRTGDVFYDGYWQNEKNFISIRSEILKAFSFPEFKDINNKQLALKLSTLRAASCHIRRGDYLKDKIFGVYTYLTYLFHYCHLNYCFNRLLVCVL